MEQIQAPSYTSPRFETVIVPAWYKLSSSKSDISDSFSRIAKGRKLVMSSMSSSMKFYYKSAYLQSKGKNH